MAVPSYAKVILAAAMLIGSACGGAREQPSSPAQVTAKLVERAEDAERARRYDRARRLYERAMAEAPEARSRAWAGRRFASALLHWGEDRQAEAVLERIAALEPRTVSAWHDLGVLRARRGAVESAERALRRAVELAPRDPRSRIALAGVLVNAGSYREALAQYERLLELDLPEKVRRAVPRAIELLRAEIARQER